jgi:tRNA(Ile)-lysidine synthase
MGAGPFPLPDGVVELLSRCRFPGRGEEIECAVSGGADSLALLVLAVAAGCAATAWHVDHGLREGSAREADVVEEAASKLGAAFRSVRVDVAAGPNLEARARVARLAVLPAGVATGHTADDQAETVLLNLLRGAGRDGLAGMRAGPRHPILDLRRHETVGLVAAMGWAAVADPTNDDPRYRRNRIRHELVPLCDAIAGRDVVPVLSRQAVLLAAEADLLDELAASVDPTDAAGLAAAPVAVARRAVRAWLRSGEWRYPPSAAGVERVLEVARGEQRACEVEGGRRVSRSKGRLRIEDG